MAKVDTNSPKVRRMLFYFSPSVSGYILPFSTLLHWHIALAFPTLLETDPQILGHWGLRWWGSPGQITTSDGFWSRMLAWRNMALVKRTHRIGFSIFELFRKIDEDFGGLHILRYATQLSCILQKSHCNFVTILFEISCKAVRQPGGVRKSTYLQICIDFRTCRTTTPEDAIFHRMELCKFLWGNPPTAVSGTPGSRCIFHTLLRRRSRRRIRLCQFCTLILVVSETAVVSFRTLPSAFHCQQYTRLLCSRCFTVWFLTTALVSKFPFLASKFFILKVCSILLFTIVFNLW